MAYPKGTFRLPKQIRATQGLLAGLSVLCLVMLGCSQLRLPKIDTNGKGLFVTGDSTEVTRPFQDTEKVRDLPSPLPKPAFRKPDQGNQAAPDTLTETNSDNPITPGMIWVSPKVMAAPIGSAVVLKAGIVGSKKQLLPGQKLEWTIAEGSPGIIESAGGGNPNTFRWLFPKYGNQSSESYAHTTTAERAEVVHQDTVEYDDDIGVARGEGWTVISSEQKGTTEVLLGASTETNWDRQYQKILVHWIDAQWQFPTSVSGNAGSDQVLTTTVTRPSDNTPLSGWTIRYKLVSNRKATLSSPSNNEQLDTIDVTTDANGQAAIRVTPNGNQAGVVYVTTEVIRPADISLETPALVVGESTSVVTWNAPGLTVKAASPKIVEFGKTMNCVVTVSNPGNQTATNVSVVQSLPPGLSLDSSNPIANVTGNQIVWSFGDLAPQTQKQLTIRYTTSEVGASNLNFLVTCEEGLQTEADSLTNIVTSPLEITIEGPRLAKLGDDLQFQILLHNTSTQPIAGLQLMESLGPGLIHISKSNPLGNPTVRKLAFQSRTIEPNSTTAKAISMRASRAGTLCHTLTATLANGLVVEKQVCVEVSAPIQPQDQTVPVIKATIIESDNKQNWEVGETRTKRFQISNQSKQPITNVTIKATLPQELQPQLASEGHRSEGPSIVLDIPTLLAGQTRTLVVQILAEDSGNDFTLEMDVTGDAIQRVTKSELITIHANSASNPLDLSPPANPQPAIESAEPKIPANNEPLPNLDLPDLNPDSGDESPTSETADDATTDSDDSSEESTQVTPPSDDLPNPVLQDVPTNEDAAETTPPSPLEGKEADQDTFPLTLPPADDSENPVDQTPENNVEIPPQEPTQTLTVPEQESTNIDAPADADTATESNEPALNEAEGEPMDVPTETPDVIKNPEANPARQSVLSSKVITLNNPITIGDENIYFVYVQNNDDLPVHKIAIQVTASEHLKILALTQKGTDSTAFENAIDPIQRRVTLPVITELKPDESVIPYQINVQSQRAGKASLKVTIHADELTTPIQLEQDVLINPAD